MPSLLNKYLQLTIYQASLQTPPELFICEPQNTTTKSYCMLLWVVTNILDLAHIVKRKMAYNSNLLLDAVVETSWTSADDLYMTRAHVIFR
jgi:hypothetical protein